MKTAFDIVVEAKEAADAASANYVKNTLNGNDMLPCGFAWVTIYKFNDKTIRKNSVVGKVLHDLGIYKSDYDGGYRMTNDTGFQNMDCNEVGAIAAAKVLQSNGFQAFANSRID